MNVRSRLGLMVGLALFAMGGVSGQGNPAAFGPVRTPPGDSALEARTTAIASQLRCPVCQGLSIQDSPSELAQQMRDVVKEDVRAGKSADEVKAYFVSRYGEWILLQPRAHGMNLLLYVLPWAAVLGGLALIATVVRRWTRASQPGIPEAVPGPDATADRGAPGE